jgi:hypothetical protein
MSAPHRQRLRPQRPQDQPETVYSDDIPEAYLRLLYGGDVSVWSRSDALRRATAPTGDDKVFARPSVSQGRVR